MCLKKQFLNKKSLQNIGEPLQAWVEKTVHRVGKHCLPGEKKKDSRRNSQ